MRLAVPLAALALAAVPVLPARADAPSTECSTYLVLASTGAQSNCGTLGGSPLVSGADHRQMDVYVLTGQVSANLWCGGDSTHQPTETTIVVTAPWNGSANVDRLTYCVMTLTALVDGTTTYATNRTAAYVK